MRSELGDEYVDWLKNQFGVGVKDYCVYWFRRSHDHLLEGDRAGLVGTNSIAEGKNREAGLDYIAASGGLITNAVASQDWSGEAAVHVSIVNWIKTPAAAPKRLMLDGVEVEGIATSLRPGSHDVRAKPLAKNERRQYFGVVQSGDGFILTEHEARELLATDPGNSEVVKPFLVGDDITRSPDLAPSRWIIDFAEMSLEEAAAWPQALKIVRERVKPIRDDHKKARERDQWWKFSRTVRDLFDSVAPLRRFIACPATSKRIYMVWCEQGWVPSNATSVFAFDDDFSMGVLSSVIHSRWATDVSTKLETRPRYTVASFATFPFPHMSDDSVGAVSREVLALRSEICRDRQIGLTKLYNEVDDGVVRGSARAPSTT